MCCRLVQTKTQLWEVQYQHQKVGEISAWKGSLRFRYGMGCTGLAACEMLFIRDWVADRVTLLNITARLTS